MALPTQITIRPHRDEPIFGVRTNGDTDRIDTAELRKAANPLHQIPFVSQVYEAATGETGSSVAKLVGGALIGGPIGFIASLASVIFEQEAGQSVGTALASAFRGEDAPVQVAQASDTVTHVPVEAVEVLPPTAQAASMKVASVAADLAGNSTDDQILNLFGGQGASAHRSYQRAQMLPYLQDVTSSQVI